MAHDPCPHPQRVAVRPLVPERLRGARERAFIDPVLNIGVADAFQKSLAEAVAHPALQVPGLRVS